MSDPLAISGVSAVLKHALELGLVDLGSSIGHVKVTALSPDRIAIGTGTTAEQTQLNLFLYHVTPNIGWRNAGLPSRDEAGNRLTNPPLALNLHYMLTAYGAEELYPEIVLGYAMQIFHETPVLTRQAIRDALKAAQSMQAPYPFVAGADLADQVELIKIVPQALNVEEMSKLWMAFEAHYRPTAVYEVSVVLIERRDEARAPLPVLTRNVRAVPDVSPPFPTIEEIIPLKNPLAFRTNETLTVRGRNFGPTVVARFVHIPTSRTFDLGAMPGATDKAFTILLPKDPPGASPPPERDPANWQIGRYRLSAIMNWPGLKSTISNAVPVELAPTIVGTVTAAKAAGVITFSVTVSPPIWKGQDTRLVVDDKELVADPFPPLVDKTPNVTFRGPAADFPAGSPNVRLRVDGVESFLILLTDPPTFDPLQEVTIT